MTEYTLTLQDVRDFLVTKGDDDELGICSNAMHCLLSETLNWRYPVLQPWRVDIGVYSAPLVSRIELDPALDLLRDAFDTTLGIGKSHNLVTKAALKRHLETVTFEQEDLTGEKKALFALADLFPENG